MVGSTLKSETPFRIGVLKVLEGSDAHLHFTEVSQKPYGLSDLIVADSNLHISSDVEVTTWGESGYKSLDIYISGDSKVHIDLSKFDFDKVYINLKNLSEDAKINIFLKDETKLWVNTQGRVGAYQLKIHGLVEMKVTSF